MHAIPAEEFAQGKGMAEEQRLTARVCWGVFMVRVSHNNKLIDLSRTVRLSGLSSGAKLELVLLSRSPSAVSVALQLPPSEVRPGDDDAPNGRLVDKFVSTTTLWHVLRRFESAAPPPPSAAGSTGSGGSGGSGRRSRNFTARGVPRMNTSGAAADGEQIGSEGAGSGSGRLYYETPVLQYMGRELATFAHLQKSLAELGLTSGTALLRLSFRPTAQPLEEAMSEIERYFHSATGSSSSGGGGGGASGAHAGSAGSAESVPDAGNADAMMPLDDVGGGVGGGGDGAKSPALSSPAAEEEADPMAAGVPAPAYAEGGSAAGVDELEVPEETIVGPDNRPMSIFAPPSNTTPQATKRELTHLKDRIVLFYFVPSLFLLLPPPLGLCLRFIPYLHPKTAGERKVSGKRKYKATGRIIPVILLSCSFLFSFSFSFFFFC